MFNLGITGDQWRTYRSDYLTGQSGFKIDVSSRVLGGEVDGQLSAFLDDGQVTVDNTAEVTRACTLTLHDPVRALPFDTDSPADTALYFNRLIRVVHRVPFSGPWGDWLRCPIFTGPVTKLDRDGDMVTVEASGKETLFLGAAWHPITLHKGMKKTDAIIRLLTEGNPAYAETHLSIPDLPAKLPKAISLVRDDKPWKIALHIARSMNMQLFYDGDGVCRLRHHPRRSHLSFTGARYVVTPPQVSFSDSFVNAVIVRGHNPKGPAGQIVRFAVAPAQHKLSPQNVGRYMLPGETVIHDDKIKTGAEAQKRADRRLEDGLRQGVDVSFDSVPVPFIEPGDLCHVGTDDQSVTFRLRQFAFPLAAGEPMNVGYHSSVLRRRHHHKAAHHKRHAPKRRHRQ
jgi:hypothetical protein